MTRTLFLAACAIIALAAITGPAAASAVLDIANGWGYNWGTLNLASDWDGAGSGTGGQRLTWGGMFTDPGLANRFAIADYTTEGQPGGLDPSVPSPGGASGEMWDVEALAYANRTGVGEEGKYYFLAILSTPTSLYNHGGNAISVGDLAIGTTSGLTTYTGSQTYSAALGVKLAGTKAQAYEKNAQFGWGLGAYSANPNNRDPVSVGGAVGVQSGGYTPGYVWDPNASGGGPSHAYQWASNFDGTASGGVTSDKTTGATLDTTKVTVNYARIFGDNTATLDADGPGNNGLDTYAVLVTVDQSVWTAPTGTTTFGISLATSCLNDGLMLQAEGGGSPPVPQLPPSLLLGALPAIGLVIRRFKGC